jgi:hypothetical protein
MSRSLSPETNGRDADFSLHIQWRVQLKNYWQHEHNIRRSGQETTRCQNSSQEAPSSDHLLIQHAVFCKSLATADVCRNHPVLRSPALLMASFEPPVPQRSATRLITSSLSAVETPKALLLAVDIKALRRPVIAPRAQLHSAVYHAAASKWCLPKTSNKRPGPHTGNQGVAVQSGPQLHRNTLCHDVRGVSHSAWPRTKRSFAKARTTLLFFCSTP